MLAYMLRGRRETVVVTLVVSLGSVLGCFLAYLAGAAAFGLLEGFIAARPGLAESIAQSRARMETLGPPAVFIAMLAPVPVQVASLAAGAAGMAAPVFLLAALSGRTLRYASMAVLVYAFGPQILTWWADFPVRLKRVVIAAVLVLFCVLLATAFAAFLPPA